MKILAHKSDVFIADKTWEKKYSLTCINSRSTFYSERHAALLEGNGSSHGSKNPGRRGSVSKKAIGERRFSEADAFQSSVVQS